ncbi:hypothetical protein GCM10017781_35660 [Deinococcus metalli]|uniref:Uncharacterized protein n=1 Tax=Deinococcus metalli TaxID=1141878 RepID=A0ABQ3JUZ3_9DEIO|nr:hypothetical protein GCM10017781_35660 [Deinococcus metalli]
MKPPIATGRASALPISASPAVTAHPATLRLKVTRASVQAVPDAIMNA